MVANEFDDDRRRSFTNSAADTKVSHNTKYDHLQDRYRGEG